jgi:hypothetical protein
VRPSEFQSPIVPAIASSTSCSSSLLQVVMEQNSRRRQMRLRFQRFTILFVSIILTALVSVLQSYYHKEPYHTSILTGEGWVLELLAGHPERIRCELGVNHHVFAALIAELRGMGHTNSKCVSLEEQLAIFLYMSMTGLTIRHTGERFQRSNETISVCVRFQFSAYIFHNVLYIGIFERWCSYSLLLLSTRSTYASQQRMILHHRKYVETRSFGRISRMHWGHWTDLTYIVPPLQPSDQRSVIVKGLSPKTASSDVRSIFISFTHSQAGKDRQLTHVSSRMQSRPIYTSHKANITLQMQGTPSTRDCLFPTVVCGTTLLNGAVHVSSEFFFCSPDFQLLIQN